MAEPRMRITVEVSRGEMDEGDWAALRRLVRSERETLTTGLVQYMQIMLGPRVRDEADIVCRIEREVS